MGLRRVGAVGLGHRARQEFARGMHRHVAASRGFRHGKLLQDTVTGHRLRARQEFARGRSRWCCGAGVHMRIIVKFGEALPCVKSHVSRTARAIFVVM